MRKNVIFFYNGNKVYFSLTFQISNLKKKCYGQVVRKLNKINKTVKRLIQVAEEFNFGLFCFVCLFNSGFADILWRETSDKVVTSINSFESDSMSRNIWCHNKFKRFIVFCTIKCFDTPIIPITNSHCLVQLVNMRCNKNTNFFFIFFFIVK